MNRFTLTSLVALYCCTQVIQAQLLNQQQAGVSAQTQSGLNAGEQFKLGQETDLAKSNAEKVALNAADNLAVAENVGEKVSAGNKVLKESGVNFGDYKDAAEFSNFDAASSKAKGNRVALQFSEDDYKTEKGAFSLDEGAKVNKGEQLQVIDNVAKQENVAAEGIKQAQVVDQAALNANLAQQNTLDAKDNLAFADNTIFQAQDASSLNGGAAGGFGGAVGGFGGAVGGFGGAVGGFGGNQVFGGLQGVGGGNQVIGNGLQGSIFNSVAGITNIGNGGGLLTNGGGFTNIGGGGGFSNIGGGGGVFSNNGGTIFSGSSGDFFDTGFGIGAKRR